MSMLRFVIALLLPCSAVMAQEGFDASLGRVLEQSCLSCHSGASPKAGLDLSGLDDEATSRDDLIKLLHVRNRLVAGDMPPPGKPRSEVERVEQAVRWANRALATRAVRLPPVPGRTTVRRLSRAEYVFTIRDLFGVDASDLAEAFPADDLGYGFDNIGEALTFSALHVEKFAAAAEEVAARAISIEDPANPEVRSARADDMDSTLGDRSLRGDVHALFTNGEVSSRFDLPRRGRYVMRVSMYANQAGRELAKARFSIGDRDFETVKVSATSSSRMQVVEHAFEASGGRHVFGVAFINDFYQPKHPDRSRRDRNLYVAGIEVIGPVDAPVLTSGHRWVLGADSGRGKLNSRARAVARSLLDRVWRRPARTGEVSRLSQLIEDRVVAGKSFAEGVRLAVAAALVSPHFLFRLEPGGTRGKDGTSLALDGWSLATRLSYFLWSSTPDAALRQAAAKGALGDRGRLLEQVDRMLDDPRAEALARRFAGQWLEVDNILDMQPDPQRFPAFDEQLRADLREETTRFFAHLLEEARPVRELVGADYSFLNARLARHYGVEGVEGDGFRKVVFPEGDRGGILGHGSVHLVTSDPTRTSPVKRGKWILENLLGTPPPPPPPGVDALAEDEIKDAATLREQLELHRRSPACASCHVRMDALGFALEGYDPLGRVRRGSDGAPVDTLGTLPDGRRIDGASALRAYVRDDPLFVRTVARKLFVYAVGRDATPADALAIEVMAAGLPRDATMRDLIRGIVGLEAFRRRSVAR